MCRKFLKKDLANAMFPASCDTTAALNKSRQNEFLGAILNAKE